MYVCVYEYLYACVLHRRVLIHYIDYDYMQQHQPSTCNNINPLHTPAVLWLLVYHFHHLVSTMNHTHRTLAPNTPPHEDGQHEDGQHEDGQHEDGQVNWIYLLVMYQIAVVPSQQYSVVLEQFLALPENTPPTSHPWW